MHEIVTHKKSEHHEISINVFHVCLFFRLILPNLFELQGQVLLEDVDVDQLHLLLEIGLPIRIRIVITFEISLFFENDDVVEAQSQAEHDEVTVIGVEAESVRSVEVARLQLALPHKVDNLVLPLPGNIHPREINFEMSPLVVAAQLVDQIFFYEQIDFPHELGPHGDVVRANVFSFFARQF